MISTRRSCTACTLAALTAVLCWSTIAAQAAPSVGSGYTLETYAQAPLPLGLAFAPDGSLFVGNAGPTGWYDPVKITRVGPGGSPVGEYGNTSIPDPDCVTVDVAGTISGVPGSVLTGGRMASNDARGTIWAIHPDQTVSAVFGPTYSFVNPTDMVMDRNGRFLFTEHTGVYASTGQFPTKILATSLYVLAIDVTPENNLFIGFNDGRIGLYDPNCSAMIYSYATGLGQMGLALGPDSDLWGGALYAVSGASGDLLRFDGVGSSTVIGTGFSYPTDLAFGPDGALYVSLMSENRVVRITPEPGTLGVLALGILGIRLRRK